MQVNVQVVLLSCLLKVFTKELKTSICVTNRLITSQKGPLMVVP